MNDNDMLTFTFGLSFTVAKNILVLQLSVHHFGPEWNTLIIIG